MNININKYLEIAKDHLKNSYCPYSKFPVSSLLLCKDNNYFTGVNIENISYGATNCAERTSIFNAVNEGYKKGDFKSIFVIANTNNLIMPCGICRQTFIEFFDENIKIILSNKDKRYNIYSLKDIIPNSFSSFE